MNIVNALEWALFLEQEQTLRIVAIRSNETDILIDLLNRFIQQMRAGIENNTLSKDDRKKQSLGRHATEREPM